MEKSKSWREYTEAEIHKNKLKYCAKCRFHIGGCAATKFAETMCNYLGITGHKRGCSPINCKKFEAGKPPKARL